VAGAAERAVETADGTVTGMLGAEVPIGGGDDSESGLEVT
jgi:hypothetical protein